MVLLTGGAGFIGSHICVELLSEGKEVVVADNLYNSHIEVFDRIEKITGKRPYFEKIDLRNFEDTDNLFGKYKIDSVIHLAGLKAVGESVQKPLQYFDNNINSTLVLLNVMKKHKVYNLVFSSSATVYSRNNKMPLTEESATGDCTNPYAWTKYMNEQIFKSLCVSDRMFSCIMLRYFNPIGAHPSGLIGEDPQGIPNNLLPYVAQTAIGKHPQVNVYGNDYNTPDGTGVRDYIHVVDLAKSHVSALSYSFKNNGFETFNIGTGKGTSVLEIISAFSEACKKDVPYVIGPRRAGDVDVCYADCSKALSVLGFKAKYSLSQMCADSWRWQSMNPNGYV